MPDDTNKQIEILRNMTPAQRLQAGLRIYTEARQLKTAWLRQQHPDWTGQQIENAVRDIFLYGRT